MCRGLAAAGNNRSRNEPSKTGQERRMQEGMQENCVLRGENINKTYGRDSSITEALKNVSFYLQKGEILGIAGESGSGKSTLLRTVCGLEKADTGKIFAGGKELPAGDARYAGRYMQMIFQDAYASFDPGRTMRKSLTEFMAPEKSSQGGRSNERILSLLYETGLTADLLDRHPAALSGGQCQRMSIARALLTGAGILLCDEITSALDVSTQARVAELLLRLKRQKGISILLVSHDLALISQLCDRVMIMKDGAVLEEGNTREVLERPRSQYTNELLAAARELELPEA